MRRRCVTGILLAGLTLAGCSARGDFDKICHAEQLSGAADEPDPATRQMKLADWLSKHIHSRAAKEAFEALAMADPRHKGELLKKAAHESGYDGPCPMAESFNK